MTPRRVWDRDNVNTATDATRAEVFMALADCGIPVATTYKVTFDLSGVHVWAYRQDRLGRLYLADARGRRRVGKGWWERGTKRGRSEIVWRTLSGRRIVRPGPPEAAYRYYFKPYTKANRQRYGRGIVPV